MVRRPRVETRRLTKRRSDSSQKRCTCRFGKKRRRRLLLACDTRLPVSGRLPVTWQTRDMIIPRIRVAARRPGRQEVGLYTSTTVLWPEGLAYLEQATFGERFAG